VGGCTEPWPSIPQSTSTSIPFQTARRETVRAIHERVLEEVPDLDVAGDSAAAPLTRWRPVASRCSAQAAAGARPITLRRRSSAFIANARVSSMLAPSTSVSPSTYHFGWSTASAIGATSVSVRVIASP
jgi:hypothetical protein